MQPLPKMIAVALVLSCALSCLASRPDCQSGDPFCNPTAAAFLLSPAAEDREIDWIYWADSGNQKIQRIRPDGTGLTDLASTTNINIFFLDPRNARLYWSEGSTSRLGRTNLTGGDLTYLNLTGTPVGLAVDGERGYVYVANSATDQIERYDLDGNNLTVLASGLSQPRDLDLDQRGNILYWTDDTDLSLYSMSAFGGTINTMMTGLNTGAGTRYEATEDRVLITEAAGSTRLLRIDPGNTAAFETIHSGTTWIGVADPENDRLFMSEPVNNVVYVTNWAGDIRYTLVDLSTGSVVATSLHLLYK